MQELIFQLKLQSTIMSCKTNWLCCMSVVIDCVGKYWKPLWHTQLAAAIQVNLNFHPQPLSSTNLQTALSHYLLTMITIKTNFPLNSKSINTLQKLHGGGYFFAVLCNWRGPQLPSQGPLLCNGHALNVAVKYIDERVKDRLSIWQLSTETNCFDKGQNFKLFS